MTPPAPITGNAYDHDLPQMAADWSTAIDRFEAEPAHAAYPAPGADPQSCMTKRQELHLMADYPQDTRWRVYLDTA